MAHINPLALVAAALLACHAPYLAAQSSCSSDGVTAPVTLFERFLDADCEACWSDPATPAPAASASVVVLDWIVPAAATRDALARLEALGRKAPSARDVHVASVEKGSTGRLRVAHGMPFNDYLGTSIRYTGARQRPAPAGATVGAVNFYLLLVESVPAGTEGTPVGRNIVRNMLQGTWNQRDQLQKKEQGHWMEARPMRVPEGAQAQRLRVVGWVQDEQGRVIAAAQSACR
jgi:hypothetical protein